MDPIKKIMHDVKVEMYGHDVGDVVPAVYGHTDRVDTVVVREKVDCGNGIFSYLVQAKDNPNYVGHAQSYKGDNVLIDNARIIGSPDPQYRVRDMNEARADLGFKPL